MTAKGFSHLGTVTITHKETPFHAPAIAARSTRLFFHVPERPYLVLASWNEAKYHERFTHRYWELHLHARFLESRSIAALLAADGKGEDWKHIGHLPMIGTPQDIPGFVRTQAMRGEQNVVRHQYEQRSSGAPRPGVLARTIYRAAREVVPFTNYENEGRFPTLHVGHFAPTYSFPRSQILFWDRFDRSALARVVDRPWGVATHEEFHGYDREAYGRILADRESRRTATPEPERTYDTGDEAPSSQGPITSMEEVVRVNAEDYVAALSDVRPGISAHVPGSSTPAPTRIEEIDGIRIEWVR
jgi:hypothetical protein